MLTTYFGLRFYMSRRGIWYNLCIDCATGWGSQSIYEITRAGRLRCSRPSHLFLIATFILETIMYSSYYTESLECVRRRPPGPPNPWFVWCVKWVEAEVTRHNLGKHLCFWIALRWLTLSSSKINKWERRRNKQRLNAIAQRRHHFDQGKHS